MQGLSPGPLLFGNFIWLNVRLDDPLPSGFERYSPEAFRAAQRAGQTTLVDAFRTVSGL